MSKWEQNAVFEYSEYICLVKRINGIVAQKTLVTELVRCKECKHWEMRNSPRGWCVVHQGYVSPQYFCADGERKESE